ncbi:MAG: DUF2480 family protein [candidate division Zixibacteria bacterium]|nr:DUF2480 family protein [candidate division Zixibacteria bacterium]
MEVIDFADLTSGGMVQEEAFSKTLADLAWEKYRGKDVLIRGCASFPVPTWAYMMLAARLAGVAKTIAYGEEKSPLPIYQKS